jgi:beta-carotene 15,15'-dioxygenase
MLTGIPLNPGNHTADDFHVAIQIAREHRHREPQSHGNSGSLPNLVSDMRAFHHNGALALSGFVVTCSLAGWQPSTTVSIVIAVIAVFCGMPHGALDVALGPKMLNWKLFFPLYGSAFGLTIGAWLIEPLVSLVAFLLFSWFHFGSGDAHGWGFGSLLIATRATTTGGLVLGLPMAIHADTVAPVFTALQLNRRDIDAVTVRWWGFVILACALPALLFCIAAHLRRRQWSGAAELVMLLLVGSCASPLIGFSTYFAVWHSPRHMMDVGPTRTSLTAAAAATVATIAFAGAAWLSFEPDIQTAIRVIFMGLAALTVPHLVVTAGLRSRYRPKLRC